MKVWRNTILCVLIGFMITGTTAEATRFQLLAVKINGQLINRTSTLSANPGDLIEVNVFGSEWSPQGQRVKLYQAQLNGSSYFSGGGGSIKPVNFLAIPSSLRRDGAFIDSIRPDFIYADIFNLTLCASDVSTQDYRFGCVANVVTGQLPTYDGSTKKYLATLILEVSADACGIFTIKFDPSIVDPPENKTEMRDQNSTVILPTILEPITISVGAGCPCLLRRNENSNVPISNPSNCTADARQPSEVNGSNPVGVRSVVFDLVPGGTCNLNLESFSIDEIPLPNFLTRNRINGVTIINNRVTVSLTRMIQLGAWTCVKYLGAGGGEVCFGHHPSDVNRNSTSNASDITAMIDCITSGTCTTLQCDTDRSGLCTTSDILRAADLLNGAGSFDEWMGQQTGVAGQRVCPTLVP